MTNSVMNNVNTQFYIEIISARLSEKRFVHSIKTAEMCRELAKKHGCDPNKAYLAGILHDICKEENEKETKRLLGSKIFDNFKIQLEPLEKTEPKLWHAPAGAAYVYEAFNITDDEFITALRYHTVARAGMTKFEKILFLGDLVEYSRDYPQVEKYRAYALDNLDKGMYKGLKWILADNINRNKILSQYTFEAYNYYLNEYEGN